MGAYSKFFKGWNYQDKKYPPDDDINLFAGSSTIRHWKTLRTDMLPKKALNRGFGGSTMEQLLQLHHRVILPYKFKKIFIYEGDNDIGSKVEKIDIVLDQLEQLVEIIHNHQPEAEINIISLKCSPHRPRACETQQLANVRFKEYCEKIDFMNYINIATGFFDDEGNVREDFFKDGMHPSEKGYAYMTKIIKPYLYPEDSK